LKVQNENLEVSDERLAASNRALPKNLCDKCIANTNDDEETRKLLEYLYLDVKVRSPDEVSSPPCRFKIWPTNLLIRNDVSRFKILRMRN
jgi:hypothetical protein